MAQADPLLAREFEAALAWWRAAGVDCDFSDDATAWLSDAPAQGAAAQVGEAPARAQPAAVPAARTDIAPPAPITLRRDLLGESPPADLAAFRDWWLSAPGLDTARAYPRIAPRGRAGAALMVLVPQPEAEDRDALLSGPQGKLLANIIAATGLAEADTYIAAALPCHTPMADLAALAAGGMDAVTAHHIALVRPARLLALGTGLAPMLAPMPVQASDHALREINYSGGKVPVLSSEALDALMDMPRLKARFWRRWMEWSASC
jgi:uracil-DNA glycosylase